MKEIAIFVFGMAAGAAVLEWLRFTREKGETITADMFVSDLDGNFRLRGKFDMSELKEGFKQRIGVGNFRTARGNPASIEAGSGRFLSQDDSLVTVTIDPNNETQAIVECVDGSRNESTIVEFHADGRPGDGVKEVIVAFPFTCTQGDVAVGEGQVIGAPFEGDEPAGGGEPGTGEPTGPSEPGTPAEPGTPGDPNAPVEPGPPNQDPENPGQPGTPTEPSNQPVS